MAYVDIRTERAVGALRQGGDQRLRGLRVAGDQRADDVGVHIGPGRRVAGDAVRVLGDAELVGEGREAREDMGAVGAEHLGVQAQDRGQIVRRGRAGGDGGRRARRAEVAPDHLGPARRPEAELLVERAAVRGGVEGEGSAGELGEHMLHQPAPDPLAGMALGHQHHADGGQFGTVRRDHTGGGQALARRVVDAVPGACREQQPPLVLLARPAAVFGEVGAGDEVAGGEPANGELGER